MRWIVLFCLLFQKLLADGISEDYSGKDEIREPRDTFSNNRFNGNQERLRSRRLFEWFKNIFGHSNTTNEVKLVDDFYETTVVPSPGIDTSSNNEPETTFLSTMDSIANSLEKINKNLELEMHIMLASVQERSGHKKEFILNDTFLARGKREANKELNNDVVDVEAYGHNRAARDTEKESALLKEYHKVEKRDSNEHLTIPPPKLRLKKKKRDVSVKKYKRRGKREVDSDKAVSPIDTLNVPVNNTSNNTSLVENVTEKKEIKPLEPPKLVTRRQETPPVVNSEVKNKLLTYVYDTYNEIINKIEPLSKIKDVYSKDDVYKIGYIISNIDTLEVNIKNLKKDVDTFKSTWEESKILDILDKLMASNRVVTNLIENVKLYQTNSNILK